MVKENVGAKMDSKIVQAIDRLVEQGEFASRSEFINQAILNKLQKAEMERMMQERLLELLEGDPQVQEKMVNICRDVFKSLLKDL